MSFVAETGSEPALPGAMLHRQLGAASPLWALFAGAALSGATWWWMSRWARPENLEALFAGREAATRDATGPLVEVMEALAVPVEAKPDTRMGAVESVTSDPVAEVVSEAPSPAELTESFLEAVEAVPAVLTQAAESVFEAVVEATEAVSGAAEAMTETVDAPVGGESAPIAPAVAIAAKLRRKPVDPNA